MGVIYIHLLYWTLLCVYGFHFDLFLWQYTVYTQVTVKARGHLVNLVTQVGMSLCLTSASMFLLCSLCLPLPIIINVYIHAHGHYTLCEWNINKGSLNFVLLIVPWPITSCELKNKIFTWSSIIYISSLINHPFLL